MAKDKENQENKKIEPVELNAESIKILNDIANNPPKSKYIYKEDGKINWFKMIPPEYLYFNESKKNSIEKRLSKPITEITKEEGLETELIVNLAGIRWLLDTLTYKYSKITINSCSPDYAAATCEICFNPSDYNNNQEQIYTQSASAHPGNTKSWYKEYLTEAAANRAFCRAVRFYANLSCVSADELGASIQIQDENPNSSPTSNLQVELLQKELDKRKITWADFQNRLNSDGITDIKTINNLPKDKIFDYIEIYKQIGNLEDELKENKITWPQFQNKLIKDKVENAENMKSINELSKTLVSSYLERLKAKKNK